MSAHQPSGPVSIAAAVLALMSTAAGADPPTCDGIPLLGTPEELAATPRADENLEMLALSQRAGLTAQQTIYDRLVADLGAIRAASPELGHVNYRPPHDGRSLFLQVDDPTRAAMEAGTYGDWDCLNDWYVFAGVRFFLFVVLLELEGIYDTELLTDSYAGLPGVESVHPNGVFGDGPTICALQDGQRYHHFLVDAWGDCPAGCIFRRVHYYTTLPGRDPTSHGSWMPNEPEPPWLSVYETCRDGGELPPAVIPTLSPAALALLVLGLAAAALAAMRRRRPGGV